MDRNDLISRSDLKRILSDPLYRSTIKDYGEVLKYTFVMDMIDNAPTIPLPDFKEGGWIYEDRQITIEEYMQSLKGEN